MMRVIYGDDEDDISCAVAKSQTSCAMEHQKHVAKRTNIVVVGGQKRQCKPKISCRLEAQLNAACKCRKHAQWNMMGDGKDRKRGREGMNNGVGSAMCIAGGCNATRTQNKPLPCESPCRCRTQGHHACAMTQYAPAAAEATIKDDFCSVCNVVVPTCTHALPRTCSQHSVTGAPLQRG